MGMSHHSSCVLALSLLLYLTSLPPILPYTSFDINAYHNRPTDNIPSFQTPVTPHATKTTVTSHDAIQSYYGCSTTRRRRTTQIQSSNSSTNDDERSSSPNNTSPPPPSFVSVNIPTFLPGVTSSTARRAWLEYTWTKGGGLPVVVVPIVDGEDENWDGGEEGEGSYVRKRRLLPLFAEEELVDGDGDGDAVVESSVGYRLTRLGPVWESEIVAGSHFASVSFSAATDGENGGTAGTQMEWNVHYETIRNQNLWQTVTMQFVQDASLNLASYLAPPIRLTVSTRIPAASSVIAAERWLEYVWWEGGGLPLPPPNPIKLDVDGIKRMIGPPFLIERLCSISIDPEGVEEETDGNDDDGVRGDIERLKEAVGNVEKKSPAGVVNLCYTVDNPGLLTYPVHTHFGEVRWGGEDKGEEGDDVNMVWNVTVRPMNGFGPFVRLFTETIITVLARNLKVHMEMQSNVHSPDVIDESPMVGIYPPRGINIGRFGRGGDPLFLIRKDTWVGSVLNAHLLDTRGVWEQSLDLFRPWRWGSMMVDGENDDIVVEWTDSLSSASG